YQDIQSINAAILQQQITSSNSAIRLQLQTPANTPLSPVGPHPLRSGVLAGFVAALLLASMFTLREYFATTLRTPDEVSEAVGGGPVLGAILRLPATGRRVGAVVAKDPRSATAEGLRVIRTNLLFSNIDHSPKIMLLTSARQGEGKTTITANLGASLAELGGRVLLIDADLRRPSLHKVFAVDEKIGLTNALISGANEPLEPFTHKTDQRGLFVMPSGPVPPNPAEMLSSGRMRDLLRRLSGLYDTIIIDSPPLLAVTDPAILSTMVDVVVLVADVNQVTLQGATRVREALERVGSHVSGVVLNKLTDDQRGSYYYNYYYRQDYGYGYTPPETSPKAASPKADSRKGGPGGATPS
ncbi:MAG TPA: polysaccharide biosynthesis tyrosine autokinase, partial [Chloroflexota bacterium]|nr:polysaccharide biosynthesis tyrosine autokinase [Chloroflexota bacterium]